MISWSFAAFVLNYGDEEKELCSADVVGVSFSGGVGGADFGVVDCGGHYAGDAEAV